MKKNAAAKKPVEKKVLILARYYIKRDTTVNGEDVAAGSVVCLVRNGEGKKYIVILRRNKQHSCECAAYTKAHKSCYHVEHCKTVENARHDAAKPAVLSPIQNVQLAVDPIPSYAERGTLNGNRPFSKLKDVA